mmetsp:Transcript_42178/g.78444  ORF Transcript_42178/g.78444 Transcript_42178/m.78444 type:complete len:162 (+) Transcript_42178:80-565(+)
MSLQLLLLLSILETCVTTRPSRDAFEALARHWHLHEPAANTERREIVHPVGNGNGANNRLTKVSLREASHAEGRGAESPHQEGMVGGYHDLDISGEDPSHGIRSTSDTVARMAGYRQQKSAFSRLRAKDVVFAWLVCSVGLLAVTGLACCCHLTLCVRSRK